MAQVLKNLGSERVWVVHGSDGLDEITATGRPVVGARGRRHPTFEITPEDVGLPRAPARGLRGGDATTRGAARRARASAAPTATSRCSTPRRRWSSPARRPICRRRRAGRQSIDRAARPKAALDAAGRRVSNA
jgi:hypothetical protein